MNKKFFITTAIPYVNAKPHVGHALEFVQADVIKRYHALLGDETLLLSGSDENALKNVQAAEKEGKNVQEFVDENSKLFQNLAEKLNIQFDVFQKGSSPQHYASSQELWKLCFARGNIYKKEYSGLYCVGCELFYEKEELDENGECFEHPGKTLETVTEENYFFKLSKYETEIKKLVEDETIKIIPESRKNEVLSFLKQGLKDISISRSNTRAKNWGVSVPDDENQKMYVWFDALNIYRSGLGDMYEKFWPADVHVIGKGIIRFHAIYWIAFLLSAGLPLPKTIFVHGYFTVNGQKMSKTIGNVVDPIELIEKYGTDALRYYFLKEIPPTDDGDFSEEKLKTLYNSDLANGLGNLVARVAKLCERVSLEHHTKEEAKLSEVTEIYLNEYRFNDALSNIWNQISTTDGIISKEEPWKITDEQSLKDRLFSYVSSIVHIANELKPFLPETSEQILKQFSGKIKSGEPLFPRIS
jgi:methionyl-tRNA synthetase